MGGPENAFESKTEEERGIKEILYEGVAKMYKHVMESGTGKFLGYSSGVGFSVPNIDFFEPSLQRLLSLLHLKKDSSSEDEYVELITSTINALKEFNYEKDVLPDFQEEFLDLGCKEVINHVVNQLEEALKKAERRRGTSQGQ